MKYLTAKRTSLARLIVLGTSLAGIGQAVAAPTDCTGFTGNISYITFTGSTLANGDCIYIAGPAMSTGIGVATPQILTATGTTTVITNVAGTSTGNYNVTTGVYADVGSNFNFADLTIYTSGAYAPGIFTQNNGTTSKLAVTGTLTVNSTGTPNSAGINIAGGSQGTLNDINITTTGNTSPGISLTGADTGSNAVSTLTLNGMTSSITTTGANSPAIEVLKGPTLTIDNTNNYILNSINVSGAGSAVLHVGTIYAPTSAPAQITLSGNTGLNMNMTAAGTWGAIVDNSGVLTFNAGSYSGGTALWANGGTSTNPSTIKVNTGGNSMIGSNIQLNGYGTLDASNIAGGALMIGSLNSSDSTTSLIYNGSGLSIGRNNLSNNGSMTADSSFAGVISGSGIFWLENYGTTTLSGANTYTGTTSVSNVSKLIINGAPGSGGYSGQMDVNAGGVLQTDVASYNFASATNKETIIDGEWDLLNGVAQTANALQGATTGIIDLGTANLTANNGTTDTIYAGSITGTGSLTKTGGKALTLSGTTGWTGATTLTGGTLTLTGATAQLVSNVTGAATTTLNINSGATLTGTIDPTDVNIGTGSTWNATTGINVVNSLTNAGTVSFTGVPGTLITDNNTYTGNNGNIKLNTVLGTDASTTDSLIITGAVTGTTTLTINNIAGTGAQTTNGILVVTTSASPATAFSAAPVTVGGFKYTLKQGGNGGVASNWYLVSAPAATGTAAIPSSGILALLSLMGLLIIVNIRRLRKN